MIDMPEMHATNSSNLRGGRMAPLWIVSLFVTSTETVLVALVTQAARFSGAKPIDPGSIREESILLSDECGKFLTDAC